MKGKILFIMIFAMLCVFVSFIDAVKAQEYIPIAGLDFKPERDGFGFKNYVDTFNSAELDATALIRMFGANNVCLTGKTAGDCVVSKTARQWRQDQIKLMRNGRCEGFSITSIRTFLSAYLSSMDKTFNGKIKPGQFQTNAKFISELNPNDEIAGYIAYYHTLQNLPEVFRFKQGTAYETATEKVNLLIQSFKEKEEFYTINILMPGAHGTILGGHSLLPFAVEESKDKKSYRISVYDSNYPGSAHYLIVSTSDKNKTWSYAPKNTSLNISGEQMMLSKVTDYLKGRYQCPFGKDKGNENTEGRADDAEEEIYFSFSGAGDLLITDPDGQKIGYDGKTKKEVNRISGAAILYHEGSFSPEYVLPYRAEETEKNYRVLISGNDLEKESKANLSVTAPGFVVGFENISLDPNEELKVSIAPDGQTLSFTASEDGETPNLFITVADGQAQPSYSFKVGGVKLEEGKTLTMTVDLKEGKVYFKDDDGDEDAYEIEFEKLNPDGTEVKFVKKNVKSEGEDNYQVDISNWDEETRPCLKDEAGNNLDQDCRSEGKEQN
jgi:hypothetical protein